jgi:hypothetical protein
MAKKGRNSNVRKRIYTNSKGNDVFKSQKHMGSPYHSQDKKTGQIKSQSKKATEERLKPTTTKKRGGLNKTSKTSVGKAKSLPAKKGTAVGKAKSPVSTYVKGGKKVKDMGQATVVGKKALGAAKVAAKSNPVTALAVGSALNYGDTTQKLIKSRDQYRDTKAKVAKLKKPVTKTALDKQVGNFGKPKVNPVMSAMDKAVSPKPKTSTKPAAPKRKAPPAKKAVTPKRKATDNFKPGKRIGNVGDATKRIESYRSAVNKAVVPKKTKTKLPSSAQYIQDWEG